MRFSEKGVEQLFKDFNIPLENVFKFFETYAKIDNWKSEETKLYYMRNAYDINQNERQKDYQLDQIKTIENKERLIRINPDIVIFNKRDKAALDTTEELKNVLTDLFKEKKIDFIDHATELFSIDELKI